MIVSCQILEWTRSTGSSQLSGAAATFPSPLSPLESQKNRSELLNYLRTVPLLLLLLLVLILLLLLWVCVLCRRFFVEAPGFLQPQADGCGNCHLHCT